MSTSPEIAVSSGLREAIDVRRLPWIRPLLGAYAHDFPSVSTFFAGNPADPSAWRETIARVQRAPRDRADVAAMLERQLEHRGAPAAAQRAAALLRDPTSVAVVTGQQAGLFGGPLYTLLKAVTTLQLAEQVRSTYGTPAVPIFWVDEEDHDWDEIRCAYVLDAETTLRAIASPDIAGARTQTISSLKFDDSIGEVLAELERTLPPSEFTAEVMEALRKHYHPGAGVSAAFAGWLDTLFGHRGLVVFESADPAAKPLLRDLFVEELAHPGRTSTLARAAGAEMSRAGHQAQVEPADDSVALFRLSDTGRQPIKHRDGQFMVGDARHAIDALVDEARTSPERFSPNVLLRPVAQDRLFPTVCYVGGPSEIAYQGQLKAVYQQFGVEVPLLYPRGSATLLDSGAARFFDRHPLPLDAFHAQDDSALNKLLENQLPPAIERALEAIGREVATHAEALKSDVATVDPTLVGTVGTTIERVQDSLKTLQHKIVQASKRKDDTLRRQFERTRHLTFPDGEQQERKLNIVFALNRYGLTIVDRLIDGLPLEMGQHHVLTL